MARSRDATPVEAPRSDPYKPEESLGYMANYVARLYARAMGREMARHGAQMSYFPVLLALWEADGQTQSELAARAQIEPPTMAATLGRMARDGLIRRTRDPHDKRATRVTLTAEAAALREPLTAAAKAVNALSVARLTVVTPDALLEALHQVAAALSQAAGDAGA